MIGSETVANSRRRFFVDGVIDMTFPNFLTPATIVDLRDRLAPLGGGIANSRRLALSVGNQLQSQWCWAATSASIASYYDPASLWTQCLVANACLSRFDCCGAGASDSSKCNKAWYLDHALSVTGNFVRIDARCLTYTEVQAEIARDAPVGTRVEWYGRGGHFQAIVGWLVGASGTEYVDVSDPIYLDAQIVYSLFATQYQTRRRWTHSYITRPANGAVAAAGGAQVAADERDPATLGA